MLINTPNIPQVESDRLLRIGEVLKKVGIKKSSWYQKVKDGKAPKQINISTKTVAWSELELNFWIYCTKNNLDWKEEIKKYSSAI
jgi:prophage regulatory protein